MKKQFASVALIGKYMDASALQEMQSELARLTQHLLEKGLEVWAETNTANYAQLPNVKTADLTSIGDQVDLAIIMGGDGTMLSVSRMLLKSQVPLVGINRGRLGFLTDLRTEDMLAEIDKILAGEFQKENRMLLDAELSREGQVIYESVAFNDVVIKSALRLIELEVQINGQFVSRQRADGLILSSPTGTTAYALSAGGPILHPDLSAISLVPISPHTLSNRPITVTSDSVCDVMIVSADDAQISYDGQHQQTLKVGDKIRVTRAKQDITLIHPSGYCYFDMLRNKLNWG
ncbi:MAG: NAD(+) kinase [Methylophilus sp.]|nr:NAD(+) kinase [Methylophilus sp.]